MVGKAAKAGIVVGALGLLAVGIGIAAGGSSPGSGSGNTLLLQIDGSTDPVTLDGYTFALTVYGGTPGGPLTIWSNADTPTLAGATALLTGNFDANGDYSNGSLGAEGAPHTYYFAAQDTTTGALSNWVEVIQPS